MSNVLSRARRWRRPGIRSLEAWNLPEALEKEGLGAEAVDRALAEAVTDAVMAARRRWSFKTVAVGGGLMERPGFAVALAGASLGCELAVLPGGRFAFEPGGLAVLEETDLAGGMVVDVGQTSVKGSCRGRRFVHARDERALPHLSIGMARPQGTEAEELAARAAEFVGGFIRKLREAAEPTSPGLVLALPCPVDDALVPGECTYGWEGVADLVPRIRASSGPPLDARVMNDAELLAESALRRGVERPALCLSLGFGPGAALLEA